MTDAVEEFSPAIYNQPSQPIQPGQYGQPGQPVQYGQPGLPVTQQPAVQTVIITGGQGQDQPQLRGWSTDIMGCCSNVQTCMLVCFCQECFGCYLASKAGETCCLPLCVPCWLISLRAHIRGKHRIQGSIMDDCCKVCNVYQCVMCQLSNELDAIEKGEAPY